MRSEFENWHSNSKDKSASSAFAAGWMCQQSKVDELKKRLDAVKTLIEEYRDPPTEDKTFQHALSIVARELEQALKGGGDE